MLGSSAAGRNELLSFARERAAAARRGGLIRESEAIEVQAGGEPLLWLCVFARRGGTLYFHVEAYDSPLVGAVVWNWLLLLGALGALMYAGHFLGLCCVHS